MYTSCNIQWIDDESVSENVIIKSTLDVIESEDDQIFFYGLSPEFLKWAAETKRSNRRRMASVISQQYRQRVITGGQYD